MKDKIEIPFGAHDSELKGWEYTIPEGMEAEIKGGKVIVKEKESEDGKFRKYILRCCKECIEANDKGLELSMSTTKKLLDYLEKQKEKEKYDRLQPVYDNLDSFDSALAKAWKAYNDSGARIVDGCEDDYVECAHAKGFREGYLFGLKKQKESSHIQETCKENADSFTSRDERMRKAALAGIEYLEREIGWDAIDDIDILDIKYYLEKHKDLDKMIVVSPEVWDNAIADAYENGKKYGEKQKEQSLRDFIDDFPYSDEQKEQKPAEWSPTKEQMVALSWAANGMLDNDSPSAGDIKANLQSLYNDLQSKSIKPAEWSEEDKEMLYTIIADVSRTLHSCGIGTDEWNIRSKAIDRLKSLRPSWKPSKEQMEALEHFIRSWGESGTMSPENPILCAAKSLYNDLKKL